MTRTARYINGRFVTQPLSGVQRFAIEVSRGLLALDPAYRLLTPRGGAARWPQADEIGRWRGQAWEQLELCRAAADGVLLNLGNTAPLAGGPQLVVIHDTGIFATPEAYSRKFRAWYRLMQSWLARRRVRIVTVSEFSRRELLRHLPAAVEQISVMPEGTDHMQRIAADASILDRHGLTPGRYVLAVGTLAAHKNLIALTKLAEALAARGMPLVVAGGLGGAAFQAAGDHRLPRPARYIGRVSDAHLKGLYEAAGCFVFPSLYEGFGLPAVEAMRCGCPVVAADIPALRESCGAAAQYCDPCAPDEIAARVLAVLDERARAADLRAAGRAHAATLSWARAAATLHEITTAMAGGA